MNKRISLVADLFEITINFRLDLILDLKEDGYKAIFVTPKDDPIIEEKLGRKYNVSDCHTDFSRNGFNFLKTFYGACVKLISL